jgi:hypothetical protein
MSLPPAATTPPLPASAIDTVPALLPMVTDPGAGPTADGANVTLSAAVCPGVNVVAAPAPVKLKPVPATITLESVTFTFPAFVRITPSAAVLPTRTLPKFKLLVLELSRGVAADAVPLREITNGDPGVLLSSEIEPAMFPAELGANRTLNVVLWPAAMFIGRFRPDVPKPAPTTFAEESVTPTFPAFVRVTPRDAELPTRTLPKPTLLVLELRSAVAADAVPLAEITNGELGALLRSEIEPATFPAELGVKRTLNVVLWPAAMFVGMFRPDVPKPAPTTLAAEIVTPALPVFCNVTVCELLEPAVTIGKVALIGVAESCACGCGLFVGGGVGVPPLFDALDPTTTPAQPLPISQAASTTATRHFDVPFTPSCQCGRRSDPCPDLPSAIVRQV